MIEAEGSVATITFDGRVVTITRHRTAFDIPAGTRTIPLAQITAVQFKNAGRWSGGGYLRLDIAGTAERRIRQTQVLKTDQLKDPNLVSFGPKKQKAFEAVRDAIEDALRRGGQAQQPTSVADELAKLADLLRAGALTPTEFEQAKARLLSGN